MKIDVQLIIPHDILLKYKGFSYGHHFGAQ